MDHLFLYGPPASGKSSVGRQVAEQLSLPFVDLDQEITIRAGRSIPEIFESEGEAAFRRQELEAFRIQVEQEACVIALGGGALLDQQIRSWAEEAGQIICLSASIDELIKRLGPVDDSRPLLSGGTRDKISRLLQTRQEHYQSFPLRVDTTCLSIDEAARAVQVCAGRHRVHGMGSDYPVVVQPGGLAQLAGLMRRADLRGPVVLVGDETTLKLYGKQATSSLDAAGMEVHPLTIPTGEANKTIDTIKGLWAGFALAHLERGSSVVALGGGVVGDLTGFAAATYLRGVDWVNIPTTLLAMVDSSLGGKTGFDLPQGKNLVGAFHAPRLVLADPDVLSSLPLKEFRGGLSETIKHGIIADPGLFDLCLQGVDGLKQDLNTLVRRGMAVKVRVIEMDPFEKNIRQALNLGHTVGHGIELASGFELSHGESVAIGMAVEARLAERIGVAPQGLANQIACAIRSLGLPTAIPDNISRERVIEAMLQDKKRLSGKVRFALPESIGSVKVGIEVNNWQALIQSEV